MKRTLKKLHKAMRILIEVRNELVKQSRSRSKKRS